MQAKSQILIQLEIYVFIYANTCSRGKPILERLACALDSFSV